MSWRRASKRDVAPEKLKASKRPSSEKTAASMAPTPPDPRSRIRPRTMAADAVAGFERNQDAGEEPHEKCQRHPFG